MQITRDVQNDRIAQEARRIVVCVRALEEFDTVAIEAGVVRELISAAVRITFEVEAIFDWLHSAGRADANLRRMIRRLDGPCRQILAARAALGENPPGQEELGKAWNSGRPAMVGDPVRTGGGRNHHRVRET